MAFSQSTMTEVITTRSGGDLLISWSSSSSSGTWFQVYVNRILAWSGTTRLIRIPWPQQWTSIDVGTCLSTEAFTDLSGSLPSVPNNRVTLTWMGGSYLGNIKEYRIFQGTTPGGAVSYTTPVAIVPATYGAAEDGWGLGPYDKGGWSQSASTYGWSSAPLKSGTWNFAVVPYDFANNPGTAVTTSGTSSSPPRPPASFADGTRLKYSLNSSTGVATLTWNASP